MRKKNVFLLPRMRHFSRGLEGGAVLPLDWVICHGPKMKLTLASRNAPYRRHHSAGGDVAGGGGSLTYVVFSSFHALPDSRSAVSTNMRIRLCNACMAESLMSRFVLPIAEYNALAAAITLSAWDTVGFMRYLCLKKTVSDTRSNRVRSTWMT